MFWIIVAACVAVDQISKLLITANLALGESIPLLGEWLSLTHVLNTGASFSILQGKQGFLIAFTAIVLVLIVYIRYRIPREFNRLHVLLAVFCGGALGNLIDRIYQGAVIDFIDIFIKPFSYNFPVFNFADCFINLGVIIICLCLLFGKEKVLLNDKKPADITEKTAEESNEQ